MWTENLGLLESCRFCTWQRQLCCSNWKTWCEHHSWRLRPRSPPPCSWWARQSQGWRATESGGCANFSGWFPWSSCGDRSQALQHHSFLVSTWDLEDQSKWYWWPDSTRFPNPKVGSRIHSVLQAPSLSSKQHERLDWGSSHVHPICTWVSHLWDCDVKWSSMGGEWPFLSWWYLLENPQSAATKPICQCFGLQQPSQLEKESSSQPGCSSGSLLELVKATFLVQVEMPSGLRQAAWKRWPQVEPLELRDSHSKVHILSNFA